MFEMRPVDVLNNLRGHALWPQSYHLSEAEARVCIDALDQYEETMARWIPVEEKLPPNDNYILLSFSNYYLPAIGRYEIGADGSGAFYEGDCDKSCVSCGFSVNAWQPLPGPYKGGK